MEVVVACFVGAGWWTLLEYGLHRWTMHGRGLPLTTAEHGRHHANLTYRYPHPFLAAGVVLLAATSTLGPLLGVLLGMWPAFAAVAAHCTAYGFHEWLHARHHRPRRRTRAERYMWRLHRHHHLVDDTVNFGVTSPVWDLAFGTYARPAR